MSDYLDSYVDRRMKFLIEEWQLATRGDIREYEKRLNDLDMNILAIRHGEEKVGARLTALEERARKVRERYK